MNTISRRHVLQTAMHGSMAMWAISRASTVGQVPAIQDERNGFGGLRSVKIGLHCAGWDPRPLSELFAAARELGYDGVELAPPWQEKKYDMEEVYRTLVTAGTALAPAAFVGGQELRDPNARQAYVLKARKHARWIRKHGGRYVTYSTVGGRMGARTSDESKSVREAFRVISNVVMDEGCVPLYHNHYVGGYRLSKRLLKEDLELLDWSRWYLCVDTGHLVLALTDPVAFVTKWAEKISWMHCKDVKTADVAALDRAGVRWQDHFTPLGAGVVDFPKVLQSLADVGYKSWLVVEQDNSPDPFRTSKISITYLRRVLAALDQTHDRSETIRTTPQE